MGKQSLDNLQTRKMKGLKRSRDVVDEDGDQVMAGASEDEVESDQPGTSKKSKMEIEV